MASGAFSSGRADRGVPAADRTTRSPPPRGHRDEPRGAWRSPTVGATRTAGRAGPRSPARDPGPAQGQHRDQRRDGDDGRFAGPGRQPGPPRRHDRRPAAGGRRGHPGQGQPVRVGQLPRARPARGQGGRPLPQRLERARRVHPQPVRPRRGSVRLELGLGGRGGRQPVRRRDRDRDRRLDRLPGGQQCGRRAQADGRAGLPGRDDPDLAQPGHRRADGPDRDRRRDHARCPALAVRLGRRVGGSRATTARLSDRAPCAGPGSGSTGVSSRAIRRPMPSSTSSPNAPSR